VAKESPKQDTHQGHPLLPDRARPRGAQISQSEHRCENLVNPRSQN
jgi:hypothetical protein